MKLFALTSKRALAHLLALSVVAPSTFFLSPHISSGSSGLIRSAAAQSDEDIERAKEAFVRGQTAYEEERYDDAAEAFLDAYEHSGRGELLYNIGKSYWNDQELKKAEQYFQEYIDALPDAANVGEVVEAIIEIQQQMADQMAHVEVTSSPGGAEIFVGEEDEARCEAPCTIMLMPGKHTLRARLGRDPKNSAPQTQDLNVAAEESASINFDFPGQLLVHSDQRSGEVSIPGAGAHPLPMRRPISLPSGSHTLTLTSAGGKSWTVPVRVEAGEVTSIMAPMEAVDAVEPGGGMSTLGTVSVALIGLSVGLAGGGVFMGMQAADTHDALEKRQTALGSVDRDMLEQGENQQLTANILYIASAVTGLAGAGLLTWDLLSDDAPEQNLPASQPAPQPERRSGAGRSPQPDELDEPADNSQDSEPDQAEDDDLLLDLH